MSQNGGSFIETRGMFQGVHRHFWLDLRMAHSYLQALKHKLKL